MGRHVLDSAEHAESEARAAQFTRIDHESAPRVQTKALQQRAGSRDEGARMRAFTRIERQS